VQCNTKISYYADHKVNRMTTKMNYDMFGNFTENTSFQDSLNNQEKLLGSSEFNILTFIQI
jgi:hypothetical protein